MSVRLSSCLLFNEGGLGSDHQVQLLPLLLLFLSSPLVLRCLKSESAADHQRLTHGPFK